MKKICTFTQTYSDNREELYRYHCQDQSDIDFRNNFDLNLYAFHNSSDEYVSNLLKLDYFQKLKNLQVVRYNNVTYTTSFKETLKYIYKNGYDYLIFLQDDCLSKTDMNDALVDFIKNKEFDMLNLEITPEDLKNEPKIYYENGDLKVYETTSDDFVKRGWYAFDDGAYVGNVKFILTDLYDLEYLHRGDIWNAETYLNDKIHKKAIQRLTTNQNFYWRYNILGQNNWDRDNLLDQLKERFNND